MDKILDDIKTNLKSDYERDGAVYIQNVFNKEWIDKIRIGIQKNIENPSKYSENLSSEKGGAYFNDYCNWQTIQEFREFVFESGIGEIAAAIMGSPYSVFYHEHVLNKEPGAEHLTPWHQDQAYYPIDGRQMCSIWMPVDPVPVKSTLRFVSGSHKWGWFYPRKFATLKNYPVKDTDCNTDKNTYTNVPSDQYLENQKILEWGCGPGDIVIFNGLTLHGARGNPSSSTHRRVLSTRWVGEDAVFATRKWEISPPYTGSLSIGDRFFKQHYFPLISGRFQ